MKNWWQRWSYEIPLAIGDALWEVLVVQFAAFLDRLTVRKTVEFAVIALLVMAFAQTLPIDLAILFAGDTLMYLEFVIAIRLAAGRMHVLAIAGFLMQLARHVLRTFNTAIRQPAMMRNRWRERRAIRRSGKPRRSSDKSGDGRGFGVTWGALATA